MLPLIIWFVYILLRDWELFVVFIYVWISLMIVQVYCRVPGLPFSLWWFSLDEKFRRSNVSKAHRWYLSLFALQCILFDILFLYLSLLELIKAYVSIFFKSHNHQFLLCAYHLQYLKLIKYNFSFFTVNLINLPSAGSQWL